jgi:myo-inositol-1(or 4)-monophosphatase
MTVKSLSEATPALSKLSVIVEEAGACAQEFFVTQSARVVESKSLGDFVSDADRAIEEILRKRLSDAFPDVPIVGEEFGGTKADQYWSVDPIDGTSNFLSGLPTWAVSVGLIEHGVPRMGVIFAPTLGVMATADRKSGFTITGFPSGSVPAHAACFAVGRNTRWPAAARHAIEAEIEAGGYNVVSFGSCALSLTFVAAGRLAGYVEHSVAGLWDCAAGLALCDAAGIPGKLEHNADGTINVSARADF